jgi:hypothetical protein
MVVVNRHTLVGNRRRAEDCPPYQNAGGLRQRGPFLFNPADVAMIGDRRFWTAPAERSGDGAFGRTLSL